MQILRLQRIGDIMLEDLLELRRILDRFIAKYVEQDKYRFEHDPRLEEEFAIQGDDRLEKLGQQLLKLRKEDKNNEAGGKTEYPKEWRGNDIY
jgi:hypothetical protein